MMKWTAGCVTVLRKIMFSCHADICCCVEAVSLLCETAMGLTFPVLCAVHLLPILLEVTSRKCCCANGLQKQSIRLIVGV
mmetsp:Transcript_20901/g.35242  ORF Transcript_20901/g.35242 Transcript_20901/m.35242 type:complete len:80 (-) Transcript_20901:123-362(-)